MTAHCVTVEEDPRLGWYAACWTEDCYLDSTYTGNRAQAEDEARVHREATTDGPRVPCEASGLPVDPSVRLSLEYRADCPACDQLVEVEGRDRRWVPHLRPVDERDLPAVPVDDDAYRVAVRGLLDHLTQAQQAVA